MDVIFNFIGMCVAEWHPAYRFFTQTLRLQAELNPAHGDWANLGAAWGGYYSPTHSLVCELFDQGSPVAERWWGHHQNIRPAIHVEHLETALGHFQEVNFTGEIEAQAWGRQIEFETVEGIRWVLAEAQPARADFSQPQFGHVALKTANFEAQKHFYGEMMGFNLQSEAPHYALCTQNKPDHPFLVLVPGGEVIHSNPATPYPERAQPFFLSFMTSDIHAVSQDLSILRPITHHADWEGTDMLITDADGNVIQIVQYG